MLLCRAIFLRKSDRLSIDVDSLTGQVCTPCLGFDGLVRYFLKVLDMVAYQPFHRRLGSGLTLSNYTRDDIVLRIGATPKML